MTINRRSLLGAMLAACAAPAYVKAGILMPVRKVWTPFAPKRIAVPTGLMPLAQAQYLRNQIERCMIDAMLYGTVWTQANQTWDGQNIVTVIPPSAVYLPGPA